MKYFIDTEFIEGDVSLKFAGFNIPKWLIKPNNTIQLISIALISEDNRKYYAISKDFNLYESWNRYDLVVNKNYPAGSEYNKVYWIRDNVLKPIYDELFIKWCKDNNSLTGDEFVYFNYTNFKELINKYGKSNKQIAEEIKDFCIQKIIIEKDIDVLASTFPSIGFSDSPKTKIDYPIFYGYYSAYDHVALSWLFGKMIDLPAGFPRYTIDLKQVEDERFRTFHKSEIKLIKNQKMGINTQCALYPKQTNIHNALSDAKFNKELYEFLNILK